MKTDVLVIEAPFADGAVPLDVHVIRRERTVVVDAGTAATPEGRIIPALEALGVEPDLLVVTHAHEDHVGGAEPLRRRYPGLEVALPRGDAAWAADAGLFWSEVYLRHCSEWMPDDAQETTVRTLFGEGAEPQLLLDDGDRVDGGGLVALAAPSHSPGHVVYWREETGELFSGDSLQSRGVPLRRGPGVFALYLDVPAYLMTLDRVEALGPDVIYTSHFGALRGPEAGEFVRRSRAFVAELHERVHAALSHEPRRLSELAREVHRCYPGFAAGMQLHATTHAHLCALAAEGAAVCSSGEGVERWAVP